MQQLTIQRVMLVTLFALIVTLAIDVPTDTDTWWHIRSGEYTLNEGMIYTDPFSHTMQGAGWINHSWGSQLVLYAMWEIAGNIGMALYTMILATAGMAMLYQISAGNVYLKAFVFILGAATATIFWSARPHMISFFMSTVYLYILYRYKHDRVDRLWLLAPLMLVWGNMHAGFSIGFILLGGFIAGEIANNLFNRANEATVPLAGVRKLIIIALISVGLLVVNPYGLQMLSVPFDTVGIDTLRDFIIEWQSPNFHTRPTWPFIFMIIALFAVLGAAARPIDWTNLILISGTLFMALLYARNIALFAVVATPVITFHAWSFLQQRGWAMRPLQRVSVRQARLNAVLLLLILAGVFIRVSTLLNPNLIDAAQRQRLPVDVAEFLAEAQPDGLMFNSYNWGGYLMFALPQYQVYVDGRTDLYGDEMLTRYLQVVRGNSGWEDILDEDGINFVVIEEDSRLAAALGESDGWTQIYPTPQVEDEKAVVFVRDEPLTE
jgi:hypothetical protein